MNSNEARYVEKRKRRRHSTAKTRCQLGGEIFQSVTYISLQLYFFLVHCIYCFLGTGMALSCPVEVVSRANNTPHKGNVSARQTIPIHSTLALLISNINPLADNYTFIQFDDE